MTGKTVREDMLIPLRHGEPIRFGAEGEHGVVMDVQHGARIVEVADVGEDALLVHDEARTDPSVAFMLSRLARGPTNRRRSVCSGPSSAWSTAPR